MPGRSQRHLREYYGIDSAGDTYYPGPGGGVQRVVTINPDTLNIDTITPGTSAVSVTDDGAAVNGAVVTVQTSDPAVATATGGTTGILGNTNVTVTGTGAGAAVITVIVDGKTEGTITVTVT